MQGMQQRIGLACALLPDPDLIFLDEPTSALDPVGRKEVRDIMTTLRSSGKTVLLNSHLLSEVDAVCDSAAIIKKDSVIKYGKMDDLLESKLILEIHEIQERDLFDIKLSLIVMNHGTISKTVPLYKLLFSHPKPDLQSSLL